MPSKRSLLLNSVIALVLCAALFQHKPVLAQDVEPRRWTTLPVGTNVVGAGYVRSNGDVFFDPVFQVEDAEVDAHTVVASYVRTFALAGRAARFDLLIPWQDIRWKGLLDGVPASVTRIGHADPRLRLSVNLVGAPAMELDDYRNYVAVNPINTVVGAAIAVRVPVGEYFEDKLLNLGENRYTFVPQLGAVHTRGPWSYEVTGSALIFTDNDEFFGGQKREQDPIYALQGHVIRVFRPGLWASASALYAKGGKSTVDSERQDDERGDFFAALSFGFPLGRNQGVKVAYILSRTRRNTGADVNSILIAWSRRF
jgi:hypothetical protein